jgi:tRNA threonylcarbamoyladenosine biosynthesis protein TsaE
MKGKTWNITDVADLKKAAEELLNEPKKEDSARVFALYGDLGAGKTTFTQSIGEILDIKEDITSPTFVIMKRYVTNIESVSSLIHIDAYRLESVEELLVLGFTDWLQEDNTLIVIEWADKVESLLPPHVERLRFILDGNERQLELLPS